MTKRSKEFEEGFFACDRQISRSHNPYDLTPTETWSKQAQDWRDGWSKRFYGELIYSDP